MMRIQAAFEAGIAAHWLHLGLVTARRTSQFDCLAGGLTTCQHCCSLLARNLDLPLIVVLAGQ